MLSVTVLLELNKPLADVWFTVLELKNRFDELP